MMGIPRILSRMGAVVCAVACGVALTGCRCATVPWENPTAFNKTPACDASEPCGDGCYVPPPPMLDSHCYGYRFTCWHPWPEHCQPQCQNGDEQPCIRVETEMPQIIPASPAEPTAASPFAAPPASAATPEAIPSSRFGDSIPQARYVPTPRATAFPPPSNWTRSATTPASATSTDGGASNYAFLNAVAESGGGMRDESVRPASRVTRIYEPPIARHESPADEQEPSRDNAQRFRW